MYNIIKYRTESGECPLDEFINQLRTDGRQKDIDKIQHFINLLETFGYKLPSINVKQAEKLDDMIIELRPIPHRVLYYYCSASGEYVLLHGFEKKTNKTPKEELKRAREEALDYDRRKKDEKKQF